MKLTTDLGNKLPTYNSFVAHPAYDDYWKARGAGNLFEETNVATLVVGGWWDQGRHVRRHRNVQDSTEIDRNDKVFS